MESNYRAIFEAASDGLIITDLETGRVLEANPAAYLLHGRSRDEFIGERLASFIDSTSQPALSEHLLNVQPGNVVTARLLHTRPSGDSFYAEWRGNQIDYQGRASFLGILHEVGTGDSKDQRTARPGGTHNHEQDTLLAISHTLASTLELKPGLILDQLREIIDYSRGGFFAVENSALVSLALRGSARLEQAPKLQIHLPGKAALDHLLNKHQSICIADLTGESAQAKFFRSLLENGTADLVEGMSSWIWVPLAAKNRLVGGLGFAHKNKDQFTNQQASLALSVANQIAITMVYAELSERSQALAVMEERQRLARNLHDAINQSLFTAGIIAEIIPRLWEQDQDLARRSLKDLHRLMRSAQAEMRALLAELRPSTLTDTDLGELLKLLGNALSGRIDVPVVVNTSGKINIPSKVQIAFYRLCQEALNNIAKHADPSRVEIDLQQAGSEISLCIRDDGVGFDQNQATSGHYGLQMMQERAGEVGAKLTLSSQPGQGTEICVHWNESIPQEGK